MTRLSLALLVALCALPPAAHGSWSAAQDRLALRENGVSRTPATSLVSIDADNADATLPGLLITERTEVVVNGRACRLDEVPQAAEIHLLEVAADRKTIIKIHFRSK